MGERYRTITKEFKGLIRGEYGKTPAQISPAFRKQIIGDDESISGRPADALKPELEKLRSEMKEYIEQDEDVLSYALFEQVATRFFIKRRNERYNFDGENSSIQDKIHVV
jgi:oxaloacetate decarboxylase alpha subunit